MTLPQAGADITLSIVSYNTRELLAACLESIERQCTALRLEVIVVDNASLDRSAEMVQRQFPWARVIRNERNRYFAPAHNQAFAVAHGRYTAILNPDTQLCPDTLPVLLDFMDAHPEAGAASCLILRSDGARLSPEAHNYWNFHSLWYSLLCRNRAGESLYKRFSGKRLPLSEPPNQAIETDVVSGAFIVFRSKALAAVGGFDGDLKLYCTEDELCMRLKQAGFKVYCVPQTSIKHSVSASVRRSNPFHIRWIFATDGMKYFLKHGQLLERVLAVPALSAAYAVDACVIASRGGKWR